MSVTNPALAPVTLTLTALEVEALQLALARLLPALRVLHGEGGYFVKVQALGDKIRAQRLAAPADPVPDT